jgi:hypothetical protein
MKNWRLIASGMNLGIPETNWELLAPVMDDLEAAFRPLISLIPFETEPAVIFQLFPHLP